MPIVAEDPMQIRLTVIDGPHKGREFTFDAHDTFIVGRAKHAHFRLPVKDKYFSRNHFLAEVNPPRCRLMDMGSTNGTIVNGRKVETVELKDGDKIRAGQTVILVSIIGSVEDDVPEEALSPDEPTDTVLPLRSPTGPAAPPPKHAPAPKPSPSAQRPTVSDTVACPVCGGAIAASLRGQPPSRATALCLKCREQARDRDQPIPGYLIVRELGRGGMGVVSLAVREADWCPVALKTIIPAVAGTEAQVDRFLREASILREIDHPHIVAFRDLGEANGQLYFAMDYVPGTDAGRLLKSFGGPLPIGRAVGLICQLLEALEFAHARRFVHRDIKPANLLVTDSGGREVVKLADFGLARVYKASQLSGLSIMGEITMEDETAGTPPFMAPEQITQFRESRPPVDQFAAAATLYNLLTNKHIYDFPRKVQQQLLMILQDDPVPIRTRRPEVPGALAAIVHRALAREPKDRFADVGRMRAALSAFAGRRSTTPR